ncbi:MAG TPA: DUF4252 domain-containing protein [Terriglobales bacterium]|nr:DUF4252 domain-containing protein [Terriglobales bacterium]
MKCLKSIMIGLLTLALAGVAAAQQLKFPADLDRLAAKAAEVVDVTMDRQMLAFAAKFLSDKDPEDVEAKRLIRNLNGIYVKSFEFEKPGAYSPADIEAFRSQLKAQQWSRMVEARSKVDGENVEVYFKTENGTATGMAIIAAEPKELTLVHIDGPLDPEQLSSLGGQFGIPKVEMNRKAPGGVGKAVKK